MLRTFALSSAESSVRKPPASERCTTCRFIADGLTYTARGGDTVPSQNKATEAAWGAPRGSPELRNPLARVERAKWLDGCRRCV
jgi:hypothetical protein